MHMVAHSRSPSCVCNSRHIDALDVFRNRITAINDDDTNDGIIITVNIYYIIHCVTIL